MYPALVPRQPEPPTPSSGMEATSTGAQVVMGQTMVLESKSVIPSEVKDDLIW